MVEASWHPSSFNSGRKVVLTFLAQLSEIFLSWPALSSLLPEICLNVSVIVKYNPVMLIVDCMQNMKSTADVVQEMLLLF